MEQGCLVLLKNQSPFTIASKEGIVVSQRFRVVIVSNLARIRSIFKRFSSVIKSSIEKSCAISLNVVRIPTWSPTTAITMWILRLRLHVCD